MFSKGEQGEGMELKISFTRNLRKQQTDIERLLWSRLRNRRLNNLKFRRQQQIGPFIVDFVSFEQRIIIEFDGAVHRTKEAKLYDQKRARWLEMEGYRIIRFWNGEVESNIEEVLTTILTLLPSSQHPSPLNGEGGIRSNSL